MQLSPLQSRLAASLAASLALLALYVLLFSPNVALAAELPLDSYQGALVAPHPVADALEASPYEPEFQFFDRGIIGRAAQDVQTLENNRPAALNLQPGSTACYKVEKSVVLGGGGGAPSGASPKSLYLTANTCMQPRFSGSGGTKSSPAQLILSVSNSSEAACQGPAKDARAVESKVFQEGAVMYGMNATGDVYIGITAPNVSSSFQGLYNFEVAASVDEYFHRYENSSDAELLWIDSDSNSALLVTRNLTEDQGDAQRVMSQGPPYDLFVSNKDLTTMDGLRHSACGLQNTAQITANRLSNSRLNSPVKTNMTLRGPGNLPKQQFHFVALNASSSYTGILVRKSKNAAGQEKRQEAGTGTGSVVFPATDFQTVSATNCKVVTDLEFCNEIQYAVPGNDNKFNNTALAKAYDDYAKTMYSNFEKVMMQIACEAPNTSLYSLARNCDDCKAAYKKWLCTVSIPRCEDFQSGNEKGLARNAGQAFPNGTELRGDVKAALEQKPYSMASRNKFIDKEIQPGPYKEVLPCEDICYDVVQSCPASIGFTCPQPDMASFGYSYGQRGRNGSAVACNYPGEARTPLTSAARELAPHSMLLSGLCLAAALMLR